MRCNQVRATLLELPLLMIASLLGARDAASRLSGVLDGFRRADVVADIGGITFSEERGLAGLLINATWVLLPVLYGKPVIKLSQAFGPMRKGWFRVVSRALLRRVEVIVSRGKLSSAELGNLSLLQEPVECADLAFLLRPEKTRATRALEKPDGGLLIGVAPSSVLYRKGGPRFYIALMVGVIERLLEEHDGARVWLCAHAFRKEKTLSNNDGPICRRIYECLSEGARSRARLVMGDYTPGEMRQIIGKTDVFLSCRLHAMVSALAMGVPVAVLEWAHKYREVQADFGLDYCLDGEAASVESACELMRQLIENRVALKETILARLPGVVESSARNFEVLAAFVRATDATTAGRR